MPTIGQLLVSRAAQQGDKPFLSFPDQTLSYRQVLDEARKVAKGLYATGIRPGAHVAIFMPNCVDFIVVSFAAHLLRAISVPINARFKRRELAYVIAHSDAAAIFTTDMIDEFVDFTALLRDTLPSLAGASSPDLSLPEAPDLRSIVVCGRKAAAPMLSLDALKAKGEGVADATIAGLTDQASDDDVAFLLYTSGTTSAPKGCEILHDSFVRSWTAYSDTVDLRSDEVVWTPCPLFHVGGLGPMVSALERGAHVASMSRFEPALAVAQIAALKAAHLFPAFPQMTLGVVRSPDFDAQKFSFVRTALNVAPAETQELIQSLLPSNTPLITDFGMTEGAGMITITAPADPAYVRLKTNGRPYPGIEVRIADPETNAVLPPMTRGEIQFRGINAFRSYYKDPVTTKATILPEGWVKTGDVGMVDESQSLYFIGRIKDILKVGGENVAPAEIEALLSTHPAVKMVQVVGKPDSRYGEVPVAFVELLPGASAEPDALIAHCKGQLANFKVPREVRFVSEWPMSATKVQKFKLRELILSELDARD